MAETHLPLLLAFIVALVLASALLILSNWLGPRRLTRVKAEPFECGNEPSGC